MRSSLITVLASVAALCLVFPREAAAGAWRETPVVVRAADGVALAGAILMPEGTPPEGRAAAPGVVILSGSGGNGRDGRFHGFAAYRVIAERLAADGVAVMITDRRGVGGSGGTWRGETIEGRAADAALMARRLAAEPGVDPRRVGLLGHSQGGWVAIEAAAGSPEAVAFVVLMAGPGQSVLDQIVTDETNQLRLAGRGPLRVAATGLAMRAGLAGVRLLPARCGLAALEVLCGVIHYSPAASLPKVRAPVLALFGGRDSLVPARPNLRLLAAGLSETELSTRTFEGANHQFWPARTGARAEYAGLTPGYVPGFLDAISDWTRAAPPRP